MTIDHKYLISLPWKPTYHYKHCPVYIPFARAALGSSCPIIRRQCDLAYGQGVSLVLHAACNSEVQFFGTDFNRAHGTFAAELAGSKGLDNLILLNEPFANLPKHHQNFDIITLSGTWTWLSDEDRAHVANFARDTLSEHGLFCLSHATRPGHDSTAILTQMYTSLVTSDSPLELETAIQTALNQAVTFLDSNPSIVNVHWNLREQTVALLSQSPALVAQEYFDTSFRPTYFRELASLLSCFGLHWNGAWDLYSQYHDLQLSPIQQAFLGAVPDIISREQLRDLTLNTGLRHDVFGRTYSPPCREHLEAFTEHSVILTSHPDAFSWGATSPLGDIVFSRDIYTPILAALIAKAPVSIATLASVCSPRYTLEEVIQATSVLIERSIIQISKSSIASIESAIASAQTFNRRVLEDPNAAHVKHLGSPVTGGGVETTLWEKSFLRAYSEGATTPASMARHARAHTMLQASEIAGMSELTLEAMAAQFIGQKLPILLALEVIGRSSAGN